MDVPRTIAALLDMPVRLRRRLRGETADYRPVLFDELKGRLAGRVPRRILEIGPRDGEDTRRLASLGAERIVLVDLPNQRPRIDAWLPTITGASIELLIGNFMYDRGFDGIEPFDVVWCTGVLYHNPEQLRLLRQLYDALAPGGILVMETATARRPRTRGENCVEIWYPPDKTAASAVHLSINVTHLPSARAVEAWLAMLGFAGITRSGCMRHVGRVLDMGRAGWLAERPTDAPRGSYYAVSKGDFPIGCAR